MLKSRKVALIAAMVLLTGALCALLYFTFIHPPEDERLSGARFVLQEVEYGNEAMLFHAEKRS